MLCVSAALLLTSCEPLKPPKITSLNPHEVLKQLISYASRYISANEEPTKKISGKFFREYNPAEPTEDEPASFYEGNPPIIFDNKLILTTSDNDIICITTNGKGLWMQQGKRPLIVERSGNFVVCTYRNSVPDICVLDANTGEPVWEYLLGSHNQVDNLTDLVIDVRTVGDKIFLISNAGWVDCLSLSQARRIWKSEIARQLAVGDKFLFCADEKCIYVRGNDDPTDINTDQGNGKIYAIEQETGKTIWKSDASFRSNCNPLLLSAITKKKPGCVLVISRDFIEGEKFVPNISGSGKKYIPAKYGPTNVTIIDTLDGRCSKQVIDNGYCSTGNEQNPYKIFALNRDQSKLFCWRQTSPSQCYLMVHNLVSTPTGFTLRTEKIKSSEFYAPRIVSLLDKTLLVNSNDKPTCLDQNTLKSLWQYTKAENYRRVIVKSSNKELVLLYTCPTPYPMPFPQRRDYVNSFNPYHPHWLVAIDASNGKELWSKEMKYLDRLYTDNKGKVFAVAGNDFLICIDAQTGQELWLFTNPPKRASKAADGN
jgi:outer membrane protein assembly factor BamB